MYHPSNWTHQLSIILSVQDFKCVVEHAKLLESRIVRFIGLLMTVND